MTKQRLRQRALGYSNRFQPNNKKKKLATTQLSTQNANALAKAMEKRMVIAQKQAASRQNAEKHEWITAEDFDPLDPMQMLQAMRAERAGHFDKQHEFKPGVTVIEKETLVPLSVEIGARLERERLLQKKKQEEEWYRQERERVRGQLLDEIRDEKLQADEDSAILHHTSRVDERIGAKALVRTISSDNKEVLRHLRKYDLMGTGKVPVETFKEILNMAKQVTPMEIDRVAVSLVQEDGYIPYKFLEHISRQAKVLGEDRQRLVRQTKKNKKHCKSAAALYEQSQLQREIEGNSFRRQFAGKCHDTSKDFALRPGTGTDCFFPETERFTTTKTEPQTLAAIQVCKSQLRGQARKERLASHIARIDSTRFAKMEREMQARQGTIDLFARQQKAYLEPVAEKNKQHLRLTEKQRGKRVPKNIPKHLDFRAHQIDQRIGEKECKEAYAIYEARTGTDHWRTVFNIKHY